MIRFAPAVACCIGLSLLANPSRAGERVMPFSGQYQGSKSVAMLPAKAKARITLKRSSRYLVYNMDSTVTWALVERKFRDCSVMRIEGEKLLPLEYLHLDASNPQQDVRTRFDWQAMRATTLRGTSSEALLAEIAGPTWDPMSFQVALIALAPQRRPGDSEVHHVIERGVAKRHQVSFAGEVAVSGAAAGQRAHEIVSRKESGQVLLYLLPERSWQPLRIVIDEVTIGLAANSRDEPPAALPEGQVPKCATERPR